MSCQKEGSLQNGSPVKEPICMAVDGNVDNGLITSSPRSKRKVTGGAATLAAKRPFTDQQRIEELDSPALKRKSNVEAGNARPSRADTSAGLSLLRASEEAKTAKPARPPPQLPPEIPPPPIPQGNTREPTPDAVDSMQQGVLKSIFSPVFQLFQPGSQDAEEVKTRTKRPLEPSRADLSRRTRSRSPEQWKVPADETAERILEPQQRKSVQAKPATDAGSSAEESKYKQAASEGAYSSDGESDTCLNVRSPVPSRELKPASESDSESDLGEELCAADLPQTEEPEEDDLYECGFNPYSFIKSLPPLEKCVPAWRRALLPKQTRNCKRKTLVLDLDETLVHSTLDMEEDKRDFMFEVSLNNTKHCVNVRQRPHMALFLQRCSELYELVIFTASQKLYAEQLLNIIDPGRKLIRHRIYRNSCLVVEGNYLKDLTLLGRDLAHTLIIDNSPQAFGFQLENGVPIESWYDDDSDSELLRMLPFLESLVDVPDVRPVIANAFKLHTLVDKAPRYSWVA